MMDLKSLFTIGAAITICFTIVSCSSCSNNGKKQVDNVTVNLEKSPQMTLSKADTDQVMNLCHTYLKKVCAGQVEEAVSMLYYLNVDHQIVQLPEALRKKQIQSMSLFKYYGYSIDYVKFLREIDSEVKFSLWLSDPKKDDKPATIGGMFRPVRQQGQWYLTLSNTRTDSVRSELDR